MFIAAVKIKLHLPWVHSLKEKRMVVKSLTSKARNQFNVSAAEVEELDMHQTAVLGFAGIVGDKAQADSIIDKVINFIEDNTEGEVVSVEREVI